MSRAVTADHVLFDECIDAFRRLEPQKTSIFNAASTSYVLAGFELPEPWMLPHCLLHPSQRVHLPGPNAAFICRVDNPEWVGTHNSHLYGIALSAIMSFTTGKLCKSTRSDYFGRSENLRDDDLFQLALIHPVLFAGPGANHIVLAAAKMQEHQESISELMTRLYSVPYKKYLQLMQAIRLVHLSLQNRRDDFGLAYFLIVAAIESVAQHATKEGKKKHPSEKVWEMKAKDDPAFADLLAAYKKLSSHDKRLKERYIELIFKFAPIESWDELVPHPRQDLVDQIKETDPNHTIDHVLSKHWSDKYPSELTPEQIHKILGDSYTHRSCFVHRGEQPPHKQTSYNRFFEEKYDFNGEILTKSLLPKYELLFRVAQRSIAGWALSD